MALSTPAEIHILVGGCDVTGDSYTASFEEENIVEETHTFGDSFEEVTPIGIAKFMISTGEGLYDDRAVGQIEAYRSPVIPPQSPNTAPQLLAVLLAGDDVNKNSIMLNGTYVTKFNRGAKRDGLTVAVAEHSLTGNRVAGHVVHGLDVVTEDGNSDLTPADAMFPDPAVDILTSAVGGVITTRTAHGLQPGDFVFIEGHSGSTPSLNSLAGTAGHLVQTVPSRYTFTVGPITVAGTGGTVARMRSVVLNTSDTSEVLTTNSAHGLEPGDYVFIAGHIGSTPNINTAPYGAELVLTTPTSTTFTIAGPITVGGTGGRVARIGLASSFADLHVPELILGDSAGLSVSLRSSFNESVFSTVTTFTLVTEPGTAERKTFANIGRFRTIAWDFTGVDVSPSASQSPSASSSSSPSATYSPSASTSASSSASSSPSASQSNSPSASASPSPSASTSPSGSTSPSSSLSRSSSASLSSSISPSPSPGTPERAVIFVHTEMGNNG